MSSKAVKTAFIPSSCYNEQMVESVRNAQVVHSSLKTALHDLEEARIPTSTVSASEITAKVAIVLDKLEEFSKVVTEDESGSVFATGAKALHDTALDCWNGATSKPPRLLSIEAIMNRLDAARDELVPEDIRDRARCWGLMIDSSRSHDTENPIRRMMANFESDLNHLRDAMSEMADFATTAEADQGIELESRQVNISEGQQALLTACQASRLIEYTFREFAFILRARLIQTQESA